MSGIYLSYCCLLGEMEATKKLMEEVEGDVIRRR